MTIKQRKRRGAVLILVAFVFVLIIAFTVLVVDVGYIALVKTELQNAADAAALSAARKLPDDLPAARLAAKDVGLANLAAGRPVDIDPQVDVEFGDWDDDTATFTPGVQKKGVYAAVRVTSSLTANHGNALNLLFAPVLGQATTDVQAVAVAQRKGSDCGRIIGIDDLDQASGYTDSYNSDKGSYGSQAPGNEGNLCSDGDIKLLNSVVNGKASPGDGRTVFNNNSVVTGSTSPHKRPIDAPTIDTTDAVLVNDNFDLPLAIFNGNDINIPASESAALPGGTYYIDGDININGTLTLLGDTTIYVTGKTSIAGQGIINAAQVPGKFSFYSLGPSLSYSGQADFYGVIYAPTSDVTFSGSAELFGAVIGRTLKLSTNAGIHYDEALGYEHEYLDVTPVLKQ